jgi:hypothetical protein
LKPRDVTGKYEVKNCGGACREWNYETIGGDKFFPQIQQTKSSALIHKKE